MDASYGQQHGQTPETTEIPARDIPGGRDVEGDSEYIEGGQGGLGDSGSVFWAESESVSGRIRETAISGVPFGGILGFLLKQAEEKLEYAEECIVWYRRDRERAQREVDYLKRFLAEYQQGGEVEESEETEETE